MAQTTTSVVQISVIDEGGYTKSFNIDNPKENLTLSQITEALQPALSGRWWLGNRGDIITSLKSAQYTQTIKTQIAGEEVSVTPASINLSSVANIGDSTQAQVTVSGGEVQSAYFDISPDSVGLLNQFSYQVLVENNVVTLKKTLIGEKAAIDGDPINLVIVVNNAKINVPVTGYGL